MRRSIEQRGANPSDTAAQTGQPQRDDLPWRPTYRHQYPPVATPSL